MGSTYRGNHKAYPQKTNTVEDQEFTLIDLKLDPVSSLFFVSI